MNRRVVGGWFRRTVSVVSPKLLGAVLATLAALMFTTAILELRSSRREMNDLMVQQAHTVLESLLVASTNALRASDQLEAEIRQRLTDNASAIRDLYESGQASNQALTNWATSHNLHRLRIEAPNGTWLFSNHERIPAHDTLAIPRPDFSAIFTGARDTLVIGMRQARFETGFRYGLALAANDRSAIVVNLDAEQLVDFRREVGFGPLLRNIARDPGIVYIAVQDSAEVLAAAGDATRLTSIDEDPFLYGAAHQAGIAAVDRVFGSGDDAVLEVVHPFFYRGAPVGILRLGISLDPLQSMNARIRRRLLLMALAMLPIGFVLMAFVLVRQNAGVLKKEKRAIETYSGQIIDHVGDGIIVFSDETGINTINDAASELLNTEPAKTIGQPIVEVLTGPTCETFLASAAIRDKVECDLPGGKRNLLIAKSYFDDAEGRKNTILIIRDLTRLLQLEEHIRQRERMEAMGTMAAGLAHEIRNPLNAVGTIAQQLRTDFVPKEGTEEYGELTSIVYSEVRRINEAVESFLRMVRPKPARPKPFTLSTLMTRVVQEYASMCSARGISLELEQLWNGEVQWDQKQIQQALMNLMQNAIDVLEQGDEIRLTVAQEVPDRVDIRVEDTGPGIPASIQRRVFDLYFTTKASGTGIGLSLVHRIVREHGGSITLASEEGQGARFTIELPQFV